MRMTTINRNSRACDEALDRGDYIKVVRVPNARQQGLETATGLHGLEWHHAAGRTIAIFCKTEKDVVRAEKLKLEAKDAKKKALFTSKAGAWRWLESNGLSKDAGFGCIKWKDGKFGKFRCSYGEPDGVTYYPCAESARAADKLL